MILSKLQFQAVENEAELTGMPKLLPCPFCGFGAQILGSPPENGLKSYIIRCSVCHASSDFFHTPKLAAIKWNHRQ